MTTLYKSHWLVVMAINFMRIDDRLIHGQIVVAWSKSYTTERILIVDDQVAHDEFLGNVLRMMAPSDIEIDIKNCTDVKEVIFDYEKDTKNTMVLFKNPFAAKCVFDLGIKFNSLNVGGMGSKPGRNQLYKNISASSQEKEVLKSISNSGVKVYFQITPTTSKVDLSQVI